MFRILVILGIVLLPGACKKDPSLWKIENLNGNQISVFGHGGMGEEYRYPMDSYESLSECLSLAVNGSEMDVCVTKDSVLVLSHEQDLSDKTDCGGQVKEKTWAQIANCKFNLPLFSRADLIPASYLFDRIQNKERFVFTFDCKVSLEDDVEYLSLFANTLWTHIQKYNLVSHCFIESFNITFLQMLRAKSSQLHLFLYTQNYQTGLAVSKTFPLYGLTMDHGKISADEIKDAHQHNLRITLFNTFTEHENLEAISKSPDFIQTDKVEYLINALN